MPVIKSSYKPPILFRNYHVSTIYASLARKVELDQERERVELPDGDFIDLDWSYSLSGPANNVLVILHGLGGHAQRPYMTGLARLFNHNAWDVAAVNLRGCSGEMNRLYRSYHAGASDDLELIIHHIIYKNLYENLALNGFSLGGNLVMKYLGEQRNYPDQLKAAVAISAPCDLYASLGRLARYRNSLYSLRFVTELKKQLLERQKLFPDRIKRSQILACNSLYAIDDLYTSKAHGFRDAADYYEKNSSLQLLSEIKIPTLLLNARNDGFLSLSSSPVAIAKKSDNLYLEMPDYGGHVGFLQNRRETYSEERALQFIHSIL